MISHYQSTSECFTVCLKICPKHSCILRHNVYCLIEQKQHVSTAEIQPNLNYPDSWRQGKIVWIIESWYNKNMNINNPNFTTHTKCDQQIFTKNWFQTNKCGWSRNLDNGGWTVAHFVGVFGINTILWHLENVEISQTRRQYLSQTPNINHDSFCFYYKEYNTKETVVFTFKYF